MIFYTAPILYPLTLVPVELHSLILIQTLLQPSPRAITAQYWLGVWPEPLLLVGLILFAVGVLVAGVYVFQRLEPGFADVL